MISWTDILREYEQYFRRVGVEAVRGPYIVCHGETYVPFRLGKKIYVVNLRQLLYMLSHNKIIIYELFDIFYEDSKDFDLTKLDELVEILYKIEEHDLKRYELVHKERSLRSSLERLGIGLETRSKTPRKTSRESFIYVARYVAYPVDTEIRFKVFFENTQYGEDFLKNIGEVSIVKFGGEQRVIELKVYSNARDDIDILLERYMTKSFVYALLLSPLPIVNAWNFDLKYIGALSTIGLGFSLAAQKRKPLCPAILEGSIVKLDKEVKLDKQNKGLYELLELTNKSYEHKILSMVGFGSFIPIGDVADDL